MASVAETFSLSLFLSLSLSLSLFSTSSSSLSTANSEEITNLSKNAYFHMGILTFPPGNIFRRLIGEGGRKLRGRKTLQKKTLQESQEREQTLCAAARKQIENERERKENERKEREREREKSISSRCTRPSFAYFIFAKPLNSLVCLLQEETSCSLLSFISKEERLDLILCLCYFLKREEKSKDACV